MVETLDIILRKALEFKGSDVFVVPGSRVMVKANGQMIPVTEERALPNDIMVLGFDDSPESRILSPALSTVHIHSQTMGYTAVKMLLNRIQQPDLYSQTVHTETSLLLRASTER